MKPTHLLIALVVLLGAGATPIRTANPIALMSYLPGTWACTTNYGGKAQQYEAKYSFDMNGTWLTALDTSSMGTTD